MDATNAPPWLSPYLLPFAYLSYPTAPPADPDCFTDSSYYETGILDGCFVITWIAVLAVMREFVRLAIMEPFARTWLSRMAARGGSSTPEYLRRAEKSANPKVEPNGKEESTVQNIETENLELLLRSRRNSQDGPKLEKITKRRAKGMTKEEWRRERSVLRFAEQGWSFVYYTVYWLLGVYIHYRLPTSPWRLEYLWMDYPHTPLAAPVKLYYLTQLASWFHQVLILNAEARRKDHYQMLSHHVITITLVIGSYYTNLTRVGCLIMVLMDWCDIWLPFAKMLRYISLPTLCDASFVVFLVSWLVSRQILFLLVIYSVYEDAPKFTHLDWVPEKGRYLSHDAWFWYIALLVALQIILCIWFVQICRVAYKVVSGQGAEDVRSDEEGESPSETGDVSDEDSTPKPISARDTMKRKAR